MNTTPLNTHEQARDILTAAYGLAFHAQVIIDEHRHHNGPRRAQVNVIQPQAIREALNKLTALVNDLEGAQ